MVLHTYSSLDVKKVLSESEEKSSFEAYRLLSREHDPVSTVIAYALLERVLVIARWQVKTIDEVGALREALRRVRELERRCKEEADQRRMIAGMLYANVLSPATEKHVLSKSYPKGVDDEGKPVMVSAKVDLEFIKMVISGRLLRQGQGQRQRQRQILTATPRLGREASLPRLWRCRPHPP